MATDDQAFDEYSEELSNESVEALESIQGTVQEAQEGSEEVADVFYEVDDILYSLTAGKRVEAAQTVVDAFDDETGKEIQEAVSASKGVLKSAEASLDEVRDVAEVLNDGLHEVDEELEKLGVPKNLF